MRVSVPAVHRTILVADVANFGDRRRIIPEQLAVRNGMYRVLQEAFHATGISWAACDHEDRGDGVFVLVPPDVPKTCFSDGLPRALAEALRRHNDVHPSGERIRLRVAIHAGEVSYDDHGVTGPSVNLAFRLVDAAALKAILAGSAEPLAVIVSPWFFDEVVRHSPASQPASYRPIQVRIKETDTIAWIATPSHGHPPDTAPPLLGRDAELSRLAELVREVTAGAGQAVLVEGESGIGKSALVRAACATTDHQYLVLWGAGDELGQALPLLPVLDALRMPGNPRREAIGRLLRGEVSLGGADPVAAASEQITALIAELCADRPVILVIDDLQWADRHTVALWTRLARMARRLRLLLIGTTRPVPRSPELLALRRAADHIHLTLGPLPPPAVMDLVTAVAGGKPSPNLIQLAAGAAGNPLFLTELLDALRRENALRLTDTGMADLISTGVPSSLPAAIENRLGFAVGWTGEVLRAAALLGVEFAPVELAAVLNRRMPDLDQALEEARSAGVLREAGENLAFRHPLIRQSLYEGMPAAVRSAWHLEAARALVECEAPIHRIARQLLHADRRAEFHAEWLIQWLTSAAPALAAQSPPLAVELLRSAVPDPANGDGTTDVLACRLADALFRTGEIEEAERVATSAVSRVTNPDFVVDLQWTLTQCRTMTGRSAESLAALEHALTFPNIDAGHLARLLVLIARTQRNMGNVAMAVQFAGHALAEAENADDRWGDRLGAACAHRGVGDAWRGGLGAAAVRPGARGDRGRSDAGRSSVAGAGQLRGRTR